MVYGSLGGLDIDCASTNNKFSMRPLFAKRANLLFTTLRNRSDEFKADLIRSFSEECLKDFESGKLKPIVDRVFKMSQIVEAHEYLEKNESIGKVIIENDL